jgi:hypothetical protein
MKLFASTAFKSIVLSLLLLGTASAMSLRELRQLERSNAKQGDLYVQYYLIGVLEGIQEANTAVTRAGGKPMFCQKDRRLDTAQAKTIFDAERKRNADLYEADMPVQLVMMNALAATYTCE